MEVPGVGAGQVGAGGAGGKLWARAAIGTVVPKLLGVGRGQEDAGRTNETCPFLSLAGQSLLGLEKPASTESGPQRRPEFR